MFIYLIDLIIWNFDFFSNWEEESISNPDIFHTFKVHFLCQNHFWSILLPLWSFKTWRIARLPWIWIYFRVPVLKKLYILNYCSKMNCVGNLRKKMSSCFWGFLDNNCGNETNVRKKIRFWKSITYILILYTFIDF